MPYSICIVLGDTKLRAQKERSELPPCALAAIHPLKADTSARWSLPPPLSLDSANLTRWLSRRAPASTGSTQGSRYAVLQATVSSGSSTPNMMANSSIFPTFGGNGSAAKWRPSRVRRSSSSKAPMSCRRLTACETALSTGGSTALCRNSRTSLTADAPSSSLTCRQSSSKGQRLSSGSWYSARLEERSVLYMWKATPGWQRPARPLRCRSLALEIHAACNVETAVYGS
mmetsp:Transcript_9403/g.23810  ORF Transcript_9403/g.23810 Transcript_9403/m.23810 type:complete len:229 (-) Transcript_9403:2022-2708(-)